jgi:hypothetical protein
MANTQAAFGFRHIGYLGGGSPDFQMSTGVILSTNTTKIFRGDPVVRTPATGKIAQASTTTEQLAGIFDGCVYTPVGGTPVWSPFWPGAGSSVDATAYIIDAPNAVFLAAALNTSVALTNVGENIAFAIGTGNTVTGYSGATIDQSTMVASGTVTTMPFKIIAPVTNAGNYGVVGNGNDPTTPFGWAVVTFNNEVFKTAVGLA